MRYRNCKRQKTRTQPLIKSPLKRNFIRSVKFRHPMFFIRFSNLNMFRRKCQNQQYMDAISNQLRLEIHCLIHFDDLNLY